MHVEVRLDEVTLQHLLDALDGRADRAQVLRPAFHEIADDFYEIERRRFAAGMAHWQPLSHAYALRKAARGRSVVPLVGGDLEKSLTRKGARWSVRRVTNTALFIGTKDPVTNLHQGGTRRMPARPPVDVTDRDKKRWGQMLLQHVSGGRARRVGL